MMIEEKIMNPIKVNSNWQLFIDDATVARATGLDKIVRHPRPKGLVLAADRPWETVGMGLQHVERRSDGTFVLYYLSMWWDPSVAQAEKHEAHKKDRAHHIATSGAMATSPDGIHWEKPNLNILDGPAETDWSDAPFPKPKGKSKANNLGVPFIVITDLGRYGNVSDPAKRYALRITPPGSFGVGANWVLSPNGYFAAQLPDFLHDPDWQKKLTDSGGSFDPRRHIVHFWDDIHEEWAAIEQGVVGHWLPSREIARFGSKDLVHWTGEPVLFPDAYDSHGRDCYDEPMHMIPFYAEGMVFGLLSWFHSDRTHPDGGPTPVASPDHPTVWPWCRKGTNEMRITVSRDGGKTWDRTSSRQAWIPHGTEHDSYDRLTISALPPIRMGDEDWFYVSAIDGDHLGIRNDPDQSAYYHHRLPRHQVALYTQKHNRYVSLTAKCFEEVLITKPMVFDGDKLQVNVDAGRGTVRVGIASADPTPWYDGTAQLHAPHLMEKNLLAGFNFDDCVPIRTDAVEHTVEFKNGKSIGALKGKPVYLMFQMFDADLYGFRVI